MTFARMGRLQSDGNASHCLRARWSSRLIDVVGLPLEFILCERSRIDDGDEYASQRGVRSKRMEKRAEGDDNS
jgi:hypothetical protein